MPRLCEECPFRGQATDEIADIAVGDVTRQEGSPEQPVSVLIARFALLRDVNGGISEPIPVHAGQLSPEYVPAQLKDDISHCPGARKPKWTEGSYPVCGAIGLEDSQHPYDHTMAPYHEPKADFVQRVTQGPTAE